MKETNKFNIIKKININIIIAIMFTLTFFIVIVRRNNGIMYGMNDDIVMKSIASGVYLGGIPSYQMVFSVFPFSFILYILYNITIKLDWYGIMLVSSTIFYLMYTIYSILKQKESIAEKIAYTCIAIFAVSYLYSAFLIDITFTVIAAIIATCCLVLYILPYSKLKNVIMTIGIMLAYGIRSDACLMIIVFFLPVFLYKNIGNKEGLKKDFILGIKIGAILFACIIIQKIMVFSPEWKEYLEYNKNRSQFYDYYYYTVLNIFPEEKKEEVFHNAGFNDEEMELICNYGEIGFLDNLPERMSNLVKECSKNIEKDTSGFKTSFIYMMMTYMIRLSKYYFITLFILGYYAIKSKDRKKKIPIFLLFFVIQFGMLAYLVYQGRLPDRVLVPLFAGYIIVNIATLLNEEEAKEIMKKVLNYDKVFIIIVSIILYIFAIKYIRCDTSTRYNADVSNNVLEYFSLHSDNIYIYDKFSLENFRIKNRYRTNNYISMSGWTICSPIHKQAINKYDVETLKELLFKENAYLVVPYSLEKNKERYEFLFGEDVNIELVDQYNVNSIYKITKK